MPFKARSAAVFGIDAYLVEVEVDVSAGLGNFLTVGLPDMAVKESKERIKAAIKSCGLDYPFQLRPQFGGTSCGGGMQTDIRRVRVPVASLGIEVGEVARPDRCLCPPDSCRGLMSAERNPNNRLPS